MTLAECARIIRHNDNRLEKAVGRIDAFRLIKDFIPLREILRGLSLVETWGICPTVRNFFSWQEG